MKLKYLVAIGSILALFVGNCFAIKIKLFTPGPNGTREAILKFEKFKETTTPALKGKLVSTTSNEQMRGQFNDTRYGITFNKQTGNGPVEAYEGHVAVGNLAEYSNNGYYYFVSGLDKGRNEPGKSMEKGVNIYENDTKEVVYKLTEYEDVEVPAIEANNMKTTKKSDRYSLLKDYGHGSPFFAAYELPDGAPPRYVTLTYLTFTNSPTGSYTFVYGETVPAGKVLEFPGRKAAIVSTNSCENLRHGGNAGYIVQLSDLYSKLKCSAVIQGTKFSTFSSSNGFVHAVLTAYNKGHILILRPDDVWLAIMTQFAFYVKRNTQEYRGKFLKEEKELSINLKKPLELISEIELLEELEKNIREKLVTDWIQPDFTTTTTKERAISGAVFMQSNISIPSATKLAIGGGFPSVSLEGNIEDWQKILNRIDRLYSYELPKKSELRDWGGLLKITVAEFIKAKNGEVNQKFWDEAVIVNTGSYFGLVSSLWRGTTLSGWLATFCKFGSDGQLLGGTNLTGRWHWIPEDRIPPAVVAINVEVIEPDNKTTEVKMITGSLAVEIDGKALRPGNGWALTMTH